MVLSRTQATRSLNMPSTCLHTRIIPYPSVLDILAQFATDNLPVLLRRRYGLGYRHPIVSPGGTVRLTGIYML